MPDSNVFAQEFIRLLNETKFPSGLSPQDMLQHAHAVNYAMVTRLLSQLGTGLTVADLASQGRPGGGPPHHDLGHIVHYLLGVSSDAMKYSSDLSDGLLPLVRT